MYTEEQCDVFTKEIMATGDGLLQFWRLAEDPLAHVEKLINGVVPYSAGFKVLDAGCGTGAFLHMLGILRPATIRNGANLFECQLPPKPFVVDGECFFQADIENATHFCNTKCDLVVCNYTLGHVDIQVALDNLAGTLPAGGKMLIWDIAPKLPSVVEIFGYRMYHPMEMFSRAHRAGMTKKEYSVFCGDAAQLPAWLWDIMTEKQIRDVKRFTVPVKYVFEKEK